MFMLEYIFMKDTIIKVFSYNIMGALNEKEIEKSLKQSISEMFKSKVEPFIALQEVRISERNPNIAKLIDTVFGKNHRVSHIKKEMTAHDLGLVLVSGNKPRKILKLDLPKVNSWFWKLLFKLKGGVPQFGAILSEYEASDKSLTVVNLHLDVFGGKKQKASQVEAIKKALDEFDTDHCIIMGDFNTSDEQFLKEQFGDDFVLIGSKEKYTVSIKKEIYPEIPFRFLLKILAKFTLFDLRSRKDWILVRNLDVVEEGVLYNSLGSDHFPVWAELRL